MLSREACARLDEEDPLGRLRDRFALPEGVIYLDGNSLGALPRAVPEAVRRTVEDEWGRDLISSWNRHGWIDLPARVGARIAALIGAAADEVLVADSVSVDLFKLTAGALGLRPGRRVVLAERGIFPTDLYVLQGLRGLLGDRLDLRLVGPPPGGDGTGLEAALEATLTDGGDRGAALVVLSHVDYRTGALRDLAALTRSAQTRGALVLVDLAHSTGVVPVDLTGDGVDLAVGCGYKFLNGGPGAPAFLFVARRHQEAIRQPLTGWLGHAAPFAFAPDYRPAPGIARFQTGTPPILSMRALEAALDVYAGLDLAQVREKAMALTSLFIDRIEATCAGHGLELASPRDPARRGAQVSFRHPDAYALVQALMANGVIGDFRSPDLARFGFPPLYVRFTDVFDAADALAHVLARRLYDAPAYRTRRSVT